MTGGLAPWAAVAGGAALGAMGRYALGLLQRGEPLLAAVHSLAHLLGALACAALGFALGRWLLR